MGAVCITFHFRTYDVNGIRVERGVSPVGKRSLKFAPPGRHTVHDSLPKSLVHSLEPIASIVGTSRVLLQKLVLPPGNIGSANVQEVA